MQKIGTKSQKMTDILRFCRHGSKIHHCHKMSVIRPNINILRSSFYYFIILMYRTISVKQIGGHRQSRGVIFPGLPFLRGPEGGTPIFLNLGDRAKIH